MMHQFKLHSTMCLCAMFYLLVPVCVSATHIAYGSIRMQPVFMVLGQSAGAAARLAIDDNTSVKQVDYKALRKQLLAAGQVLKLPTKIKPKPKSTSVKSARRLNVLFLVSDDLRPELGCYGNKTILSPNIDKLANQGLTFNRAYCQQAVCSPSRTSVMTGARPDTTRVWNLTTHFRKALPEVVTLPQLFKENGYVTQGLGKIFHGQALDDPPSWSTSATIENPKADNSGNRKKQLLAKSRKSSRRKRGPAFRISDDPPNGGGEGRLTDEAIATLSKLKTGSQPFFLAVGFRKPHLPFVVPKAYWDLYDPKKIPRATNRFLPQGAPDYALVDRNEMWNYREVHDTSDLPEEYARQLKHGYYAAISYMGAQLGRVLDELDSQGLRENTVI